MRPRAHRCCPTLCPIRRRHPLGRGTRRCGRAWHASPPLTLGALAWSTLREGPPRPTTGMERWRGLRPCARAGTVGDTLVDGRPPCVWLAGCWGGGPCHGAPTRGTPADECLVVRYTVVPVDAPRGRLRVVRRVARVPPRPASTGGPCFTFKRPVLPDVEAATAGRSAFVALAAAV